MRRTNPASSRVPARKAREVPQPPLPSREREILTEIREMQMEIDTLKRSVLSHTNLQTLESDFYREFQRLSKEVKESLEKNRESVDRMEAEIKFLKEDMARIVSIEEEMNRLNMKGLTRDVEGLKEKSRWLETSFKGFDIDPIMEKITEIEDKIKILKASQPLILD